MDYDRGKCGGSKIKIDATLEAECASVVIATSDDFTSLDGINLGF